MSLVHRSGHDFQDFQEEEEELINMASSVLFLCHCSLNSRHVGHPLHTYLFNRGQKEREEERRL